MKRGMDGQALTFVRCGPAQFEAVMAMYERAVAELERTVNYPKWSEEHPSRDYVKEAIEKGEQFACVSGGAVLGAVVLNEDPEGDYSHGHWSKALRPGEFLAVHLLAVDPAYKKQGIGGFLTDHAIAYAGENGYRAVRLDIVPDNLPAKRLYTSRGFTSAGQMDLRPELEEIPIFELYELNLR
jgi:ribosomal protein S18 acetylase RimI-like enzyme